MNAPTDLKSLLSAWEHFRAVSDIGPIRDDAHYVRMTALLNDLLEETACDEQHPAMALVDVVSDFIAAYESTLSPLPKATGVEALKFLMAQHGLRQRDMSEIGSQGVVSEVLSGKRKLNVRQVRELSRRFSVSPATFL